MKSFDNTKQNPLVFVTSGFIALAGDEGFEPPQTESESVVLPLHKSPTDLFNG